MSEQSLLRASMTGMFTLRSAYRPKQTFKVNDTDKKKHPSRFFNEKSGGVQYRCLGITPFRIKVKVMLTINWMNRIYVKRTRMGWLKLNTLSSNLFKKPRLAEDAPYSRHINRPKNIPSISIKFTKYAWVTCEKA